MLPGECLPECLDLTVRELRQLHHVAGPGTRSGPANRDYIVTVINRLYLSVHSLRYRRRGLYSFRHGTGISFIDSLRLIMFELIVWLWCCQLSAVRPHSSCQCDRYRLLSVQTLAPSSHTRVWCQPQHGSAVLMLR